MENKEFKNIFFFAPNLGNSIQFTRVVRKSVNNQSYVDFFFLK